MNNERIKIVVMILKYEMRIYLNFRHYFAIFLLLQTVLESFNADDEILRTLTHPMPFY